MDHVGALRPESNLIIGRTECHRFLRVADYGDVLHPDLRLDRE
jgi:hypothetical protein